MKGKLILALLVVELLPASAVLSAPEWAKPGVYIKYSGVRYEPYVERLAEKGIPASVAYTSYIFNAPVAFYTMNPTPVRIKTRFGVFNELHEGVVLRLPAWNTRGHRPLLPGEQGVEEMILHFD